MDLIVSCQLGIVVDEVDAIRRVLEPTLEERTPSLTVEGKLSTLFSSSNLHCRVESDRGTDAIVER